MSRMRRSNPTRTSLLRLLGSVERPSFEARVVSRIALPLSRFERQNCRTTVPYTVERYADTADISCTHTHTPRPPCRRRAEERIPELRATRPLPSKHLSQRRTPPPRPPTSSRPPRLPELQLWLQLLAPILLLLLLLLPLARQQPRLLSLPRRLSPTAKSVASLLVTRARAAAAPITALAPASSSTGRSTRSFARSHRST